MVEQFGRQTEQPSLDNRARDLKERSVGLYRHPAEMPIQAINTKEASCNSRRLCDRENDPTSPSQCFC